MTDSGRPQASFGSEVFTTFAGRVAAAFLLIFLRFFLALFLGPAQQGEYYAFVQAAFILALVWSMGMGQSAMYFLNKPDRDTAGTALGTFHFTLPLAAACALVVAYPLLLLSERVDWFGTKSVVASVLVASVLLAVFQNGQGVLLGLRRSGSYVVLSILLVALQLAALLAFVGAGAGALKSAMGSYCVAVALVCIGAYWITRRATGRSATPLGARLGARVAFGAHMCISGVLSVVTYRIDFFAVSRFQGAEMAGLYSVAEMLGEIVWFVPDAIVLILLPRAVRAEQGDATERSGPHAASRHAMLLSTAATAAIGICGTAFLLTVGSAYRGALPAFLVSLVGVWIASAGKVVFTMLVARGDLLHGNLALAGSLIATAAGVALLVPSRGIVGAAAASTVGFAVGAVLVVWRYCRTTATPVQRLLMPTRADAAYYLSLAARIAGRRSDA